MSLLGKFLLLFFLIASLSSVSSFFYYHVHKGVELELPWYITVFMIVFFLTVALREVFNGNE